MHVGADIEEAQWEVADGMLCKLIGQKQRLAYATLREGYECHTMLVQMNASKQDLAVDLALCHAKYDSRGVLRWYVILRKQGPGLDGGSPTVYAVTYKQETILRQPGI